VAKSWQIGDGIMKVAVRSAGTGRDFDYSWKGDDLPEFDSIKNLIESESPSVVIKSQSENLLLVITGIKSNRKDFGGRVIRNSVTWLVAKNVESEKGIRRLASLALKDQISSELDKLIFPSEDKDFTFDKDALRKMVSMVEGIDSRELDKTRGLKQIAKVGEENKRELAQELEKYRLPNKDGVLVVVTGVKSERVLKDAEVWRGLSLNVTSDEFEPYKTQSDKSSVFLKAIIIIVAVMIALILFFILKP
jgi:hypothetical protein